MKYERNTSVLVILFLPYIWLQGSSLLLTTWKQKKLKGMPDCLRTLLDLLVNAWTVLCATQSLGDQAAAGLLLPG